MTHIEDTGHAISIGFAGGFARLSELSRLGSGHGHLSMVRFQHSMTMDASLQHTTLGTLHEVRHTATE